MSPGISRTCLHVTAGRALGARQHDPAVRNPDYLAEKLLGPEERLLISEQASARALEQDDATAAQNIEAQMTALMMQVRTRFIEDRMAEEFKRGVFQLVILGAGFDTRAYRLTDMLRHARIFEVDQPSMQAYKKRRIREEGIAVPENLTWVPVDFRHERAGDVLATVGYDARRPTFFIWEGVTMYLTEAAVSDMLRWIALQAHGSVLIFDFVNRSSVELMQSASFDHLPEPARQAIARVRRLEEGEPWIFGMPDGQVKEFLAERGLHLRELLPIGGDESRRRYLTRTDGSFYLPLPADAPAQRGGGNLVYAIAEASVEPAAVR